MSEIVFILGAGASKEAGAPVMADFLAKADELYRANKLDNFKQDFERVFNVISELQAVHSKAELDLDNIESVFAAFEMGQLINKLPGLSENDIQLALVSIRKLIFKTLEETINYPVIEERIHPPSPYNSFVELVNRIHDYGTHKRCSIITFNYDLALDYALNFYGYPAEYCLSESKKPSHIPLMKLHGSLNWGRCSKCQEIVPWDIRAFFQKRTFSFLERLKFVHLRLASNLSFSGLRHCEENINTDPVIVPPTWNKTQYHQGLSEVWENAALELSTAENIFVSGYSLPENDSFFRYLFALGAVGKARVKRFWVFDPDAKVEQRFRQLIGADIRNKFRFENKTFSEAISQIGGEFPSKT